MFEDEFTLDNLSRTQLVAMCKYMGLTSYGHESWLRWQLSQKLRQLKNDDKVGVAVHVLIFY
jgi:LETM1 and EF-hand domain-containing protein 1